MTSTSALFSGRDFNLGFQEFAKDLLLDPSTRNVNDVHHVVQAAASSTSADRAKAFLKEVGAPDGKAYGSYKELVNDPDVDIVYVATPHSHHYQNTRLCLEAGKPVLLEKAFTTNAEQGKSLIDLARQKGLFLMEAQWTRYFPLAVNIRKMVTDGTLGDIRRMFADNAFGEDVEKKFDVKHRIVNKDLAGGALLDRTYLLYTTMFPTNCVLQSASTPFSGSSRCSITRSQSPNKASPKFSLSSHPSRAQAPMNALP